LRKSEVRFDMWRAGQISLREIGLEFLVRNDLRIFTAEIGDDFSFVTDEHHSFGLQIGLTQFFGRCRLDRAIVPKQNESRPGAFGRKLETDGARGGEGVIVVDSNSDIGVERAEMAGAGFHRNGCIQVKLAEYGPKAVMSHIRQGAAAELIPTTEYRMCI